MQVSNEDRPGIRKPVVPTEEMLAVEKMVSEGGPVLESQAAQPTEIVAKLSKQLVFPKPGSYDA